MDAGFPSSLAILSVRNRKGICIDDVIHSSDLHLVSNLGGLSERCSGETAVGAGRNPQDMSSIGKGEWSKLYPACWRQFRSDNVGAINAVSGAQDVVGIPMPGIHDHPNATDRTLTAVMLDAPSNV